MTRTVLRLAALLCLALGTAPAQAQEMEERADLAALFAEAGTAGTIVVHDHVSGKTLVGNRERAERPYSPSSTFKIPNTLLALRLGVVTGMDETFAPPATPFLVRGKPFLPAACNSPATLAVALQNSCIPVYQDIAGRIGKARYDDFLVRMNYAQPKVTDANLKDFWLTGAITISARDQVAFLDRLIAGRLPFQPAHIEAMWAPLAAGESEKGTLFAKTGWVFTAEPEVGWYVGWVRKDGAATASFALNLDLLKPDHAKARREIVLKGLKILGLW